MDKAKAKQMFESHQIPIDKSEAYQITKTTDINTLAEKIKNSFVPPFVIKPNREGSTLGLTIVDDKDQVKEAIDKAAASDDTILAEAFIKGKELTVPVMGSLGEEKALPIIEIIPKNDLYDYESKYSPGGSEHVIPAQIDKIGRASCRDN